MQSIARDGRLPDMVAVKRSLGSELTECGGVDYLIQIADSPASAGNLIYYARAVSDLWKRREVRDRAASLARGANNEQTKTVRELLSSAHALTHGIRVGGDMVQGVEDVEVNEEIGAGVPSGFDCIDRFTVCRGFPKSHVTVILGPRGNGKTYLQTQHCVQVMEDFKRACFVTLEMTPAELLSRMVQQRTGRYRRPTNEFERTEWDKQLALLKALPLTFINPRNPGESDIESITSIIRAEHELDPFEAIYLDYYQLVTTARAKELRGDPVQCLSIIARELKALAVECACPVIVAAQNHDQTGTTKAVDLQVKGARAMEEVAALIIGNIIDTSGKTDMAIGKNRFGQSRVESLPISWDSKYCRFVEAKK